MSTQNDGPFDLSDAARSIGDADLPDVQIEDFDLDEFVEEVIDVIVDAVTDDAPDDTVAAVPELPDEVADLYSTSSADADPTSGATPDLADVPDLSELSDLYDPTT